MLKAPSLRCWKAKIRLEAVFWKLDLVDKAGEDEVVKVLCLELLLKAACSSLSCFAEAEPAKAFLFQDDHKDQANKNLLARSSSSSSSKTVSENSSFSTSKMLNKKLKLSTESKVLLLLLLVFGCVVVIVVGIVVVVCC